MLNNGTHSPSLQRDFVTLVSTDCVCVCVIGLRKARRLGKHTCRAVEAIPLLLTADDLLCAELALSPNTRGWAVATES